MGLACLGFVFILARMDLERRALVADFSAPDDLAVTGRGHIHVVIKVKGIGRRDNAHARGKLRTLIRKDYYYYFPILSLKYLFWS